LSLSFGCASSSHGTKIDDNKVSQIQKGVTTRAEVEQLLGRPAQTSLTGNGGRMMLYQYSESKQQVKATSFIPIAGAFMGGTTGTMRMQQLQIVLNKDNVVEDLEMNDGTNNMDSSHGFGRATMSSSPTPASSSAK
jgi:outer membrane protein assembly factor BamE (lipoprotein component of BamABCDE complex)